MEEEKGTTQAFPAWSPIAYRDLWLRYTPEEKECMHQLAASCGRAIRFVDEDYDESRKRPREADSVEVES
jgi:hypothetical protein